MAITFTDVHDCAETTVYRIEGYNLRDGLAHGSLDVALYACDAHRGQLREHGALNGLTIHTARPVGAFTSSCGELVTYQ
ncbi:hypothetical protein [Allosalinactinospora lopnorensis]|uniref:hypothetical protein n=1 Tax=Allosalinactinospora lopnorensis TaxID=1352348 RepID=UPI000623EE86|nr:hypothetical protein [Allosalinactinospora lopnorensis]